MNLQLHQKLLLPSFITQNSVRRSAIPPFPMGQTGTIVKLFGHVTRPATARYDSFD